MGLRWWEGKSDNFEICQSIPNLTRSDLKRNYFIRNYFNVLGFYQSQTNLRGRENTQLQSPLAILYHLMAGGELRSTCKVHSRSTGSLKDQALIIGLYDTSPTPIPYHHMTNSLFTAVHLIQYIVSGYQEIITRHTTRQKTQLEETEQVSKPESDTA